MLSPILATTTRVSLIALLFTLIFAVSAESVAPVVEKSTFPAAGQHETLLHIEKAGRYSIQVHSQQGSRVELVDRMAGPMASAGQVGKQDGRVDIFLDRGTYKIRLSSHPKAQGELTLNAFAFKETQPADNPVDRPLLKDRQLENTTLGDLEQRSYWLYVEQRNVLTLEALGRNLKDCRIWRNGDWLVDVEPAISQYEPVPGQPMTYVEFYHTLPPGFYRVTCYGGEALQWAEDSPESPLYLRLGIPRRGTNGKIIHEISPFGRDVYLVPGQADFFEMTRKEKKKTRLGIGIWNAAGSRHTVNRRAHIEKTSRDPWCSLSGSRANGLKNLVIEGKPGDKVLVSHFRRREEYSFSRGGDYWISLHTSAAAQDTIDASALLIRRDMDSRRAWIEEAEVIEIGSGKSAYRTINALGETTVFFDVLEEGVYVIEEAPGGSAKCQYRMEFLLLPPPEDDEAPPFVEPETPLELTRGFYVLTIRPTFTGILSFVVRKKGSPPSFNPLDEQERIEAQRIVWPRIDIARDSLLFLNPRHNVVSGLIVRQLPLDLRDPLPVTLLPDEHIPMNIQVKESSRLVIENDADMPFEISGYSQPISSGAALEPGKYTLYLRNAGEQAALFTVKTVPVKDMVTLTETDLLHNAREIETFPVLTAQKPLCRDFERGERQHVTLRVEEPGLYRLETSGRLATSLTVRTRLIPSLFSNQQNGIGRNALVQQYLRPGEYQVTVQTQGRSKGHAGIHLRRNALTQERGLKTGILKKITLAPDAAVRYGVTVEQPGEYILRTLGLNKSFAWRLEDHEGWPLVKPNQRGLIQRSFEPGTYFYYSLPEAVESRRVTELKLVENPLQLEGKGPHPLSFNQEVEHTWREEEGRPPDVYVLDVPDPADATVYLAEDMQADVYKCNFGARTSCPPLLSGQNAQVPMERIAWIRGGMPREFDEWPPGRYVFHVRGIEESDYLPYTLLVDTDDLLTGVPQTVQNLPASLTVKVGEDSLVDVFSYGRTDVKASLWQGEQRIAWNDDMADDWNFLISQNIQAGTYRLRLEQVGSAPVKECVVNMAKRSELELEAQNIPFTVTPELDRDVISIPFTISPKEQLLHVSASGGGTVTLAVMKDRRTLTECEGDLFLPVADDTTYTLRVWRTGQSTGELTVQAESVAFERKDLSSGAQPLKMSSDSITAFKLTHADNMSYRVQQRGAGTLSFSPRLEQPFQKVENMPIVMDNRTGWLVHLPGHLRNAGAPAGGGRLESGDSTLHIVPFALSQDGLDVVELGRYPLPFDFEQTRDAPMLVDVESTGAQIGAMVSSNGYDLSRLFSWFGMDMKPSRTVTAVPGQGHYRGKIWSTKLKPVQGRIRLKTRSFPVTQAWQWKDGFRVEESLKPGASHTISLDAMPHSLNLLLSKGLSAFVWQGEQAVSMLSAASGNAQHSVNVESGRLFVLNTGSQPALYRIEETLRSPMIQTLDEKQGFEDVLASSRKVLLTIAKTGKPVFVAGDEVESRFLQDDGQLVAGEKRRLPHIGTVRHYPPATGILELRCGAGYVRVWQSTAEMPQQHFPGPVPQLSAEAYQQKGGELKNCPQTLTFAVDEPTYIIAHATAPGITSLLNQDRVLAVSVSSQRSGRQLEYFLKPGEYDLYTRPLAGLRQEGLLTIQNILPDTLDRPSEQGNRLIQANETQVYRFTVTADAKVGVGVHTQSDRLETQLLDSDFTLISNGPLIIEDLKAGEYIFTVKSIDSDAQPVQYRPVLYGHRGSRQGIPPEVLEKYQGRN